MTLILSKTAFFGWIKTFFYDSSSQKRSLLGDFFVVSRRNVNILVWRRKFEAKRVWVAHQPADGLQIVRARICQLNDVLALWYVDSTLRQRERLKNSRAHTCDNKLGFKFDINNMNFKKKWSQVLHSRPTNKWVRCRRRKWRSAIATALSCSVRGRAVR